MPHRRDACDVPIRCTTAPTGRAWNHAADNPCPLDSRQRDKTMRSITGSSRLPQSAHLDASDWPWYHPLYNKGKEQEMDLLLLRARDTLRVPDNTDNLAPAACDLTLTTSPCASRVDGHVWAHGRTSDGTPRTVHVPRFFPSILTSKRSGDTQLVRPGCM